MLRTQEEYYKKELKGKNFLMKNGYKLYQKILNCKRPIVVKGVKAVIVESIDDLNRL